VIRLNQPTHRATWSANTVDLIAVAVFSKLNSGPVF
jgi:hypothetical protein